MDLRDQAIQYEPPFSPTSSLSSLGEISMLKEELQKKNRHIHQLRAQLESTQLEASQHAVYSKQHIQRMQFQLEQLAAKDPHTAKLKKLSDLNTELWQKVDELSFTVNALQKERDLMWSEAQAAKVEAQVYKEDFEIERSDRAKAHGQIDGYKGRVRNLEEELKQTQENLKQTELELSEHKKQVEELQGVNQRRERELEVTVGELGSAQLEAQTSTSQMEEYTAELDALKTKASDLEERNSGLIKTMDTVRTQLERTKQELKEAKQVGRTHLVEQYKSQLAAFEGQTARLLKDKGGLQIKVQEVENQKTKLEELIDSLQAKVAELQGQNKYLEDTVRNQVAELSRQNQHQEDNRHSRDTEYEQFWRVSHDEVHILEGEEHILGRGAWGYVAEGRFRGQRVAVKCLHKEIIYLHTIQRVQREIHTMAHVRHPNLVLFIAAVYDHEKPPLIVTELLDTSLRTASEKNLLGPHRLSILRDVACALNYLHQHKEPIVHRDVSASNVLLEALADGKWKGKLSDFGSANLARLCQTFGEGAFSYAAPEMFPQPPGAPSLPQTAMIDVYSYGVLLCEMAAGQLGWHLPDPTRFKIMALQVQKDWPLMHSLVNSCTEWNPNDRPTMAKVLDEVDKIRSKLSAQITE